MIVILAICYASCVLLAFKVIKIKPTPASIATAVLIGVLLLGGVVIIWKQSAPITNQIVVWRRVLQVSPDVREFVSQVHVQKHEQVSKGQPLFEIAPERFQQAVGQATAELAAAEATVSQLEAGITAAEAAVRKSQAEVAAAKGALDSAVELQEKNAGAIAKLKVEAAEQGYRTAQADQKVKQASLKQAKAALLAAKNSVDVAQAMLNKAAFDLERCTFRSPVDGQVMNWQVNEGTPVARWAFAASGTVMDFAETEVVAVFPQNLVANIQAGDKVEIALKRRPGQVLPGSVESLVKFTGEGQMVPSATLPSAASLGSKGFLAVRVRLDDNKLAKTLPLGGAGSLAVYTDSGKPFHIISKIVIRMKGWLNYLPL